MSQSPIPLRLWFIRFARQPFKILGHLLEPMPFSAHLEATHAALKNRGLQQTVGRILGRDPAEFEALAKLSILNADSRRKLQYVSEVINSALYGHHTGKKGAIQLGAWSREVGDTASVVGPALDAVDFKFAFDGVRVLGLPQASRAASEWSDRRYEIAIAKSLATGVDAGVHAAHARAAEAVAAFVRSEWPGGNALLLLALDSMTVHGKPYFFEVHIPGRSLGIHLLPFLLKGEQQLRQYARSQVSRLVLDLRDAVPAAMLVPQGQTSDGEFGRLETAMVQALCHSVRDEPSSDRVPLVHELSGEPSRLDVGSDRWLDRAHWLERLNDDAHTFDGVSQWRLILRSEGVLLDKEVPEEWGDWFVLKPRVNLPWWSKHNARVSILNRTSPRHVQAFKRAVALEDVIVERLFVSDFNANGGTQEYRSFWVLPLLAKG
ncbi:MAG: hypothetical protein AAGA68_07155 [Pseudomonadota bacterium]